MKEIIILGSTGSIGRSALNVLRQNRDKFSVLGLSAYSNIRLLYEQIKEFKPAFVCVGDEKSARKLKTELKASVKLLAGSEGLGVLAQKKAGVVLLAIAGSNALLPLLKAAECGQEIALANKEALVMAGNLVMETARKSKARIIPVDSEQSAIWQCLNGEKRSKLKRIYLTASGGPFRNASRKALEDVSVDRVLKHPRWKMGPKITVDSASLMNKGLELLEAMFLFGVPADKIKVLIHPEALIHSMVEFIDGVIMAQLSAADMRVPIQYALSYPERMPNSDSVLDFYKISRLNFERPDFKKFPCLRLAYRAAEELGTMPCALNAANEVSVEAFLGGRLEFLSISKVVERVLDDCRNIKNPDLGGILEADIEARRRAQGLIERMGS